MGNQILIVQLLTILLINVIVCFGFHYINPNSCRYTPTTVSGTKAPSGQICKGQLILDEKFVEFDRELWKHELTLGGGGVSTKIVLKIYFFFILFN